MVDSGSERVVEGRASARAELLDGQRPDLVQSDAVIEDFAALIKEHDGNVDRSRIFLLLLFDKIVEAVDRASRATTHRTAAIEN